MRINRKNILSDVLAMAVCLGCTAQARPFWLDGGQGGGAVEQLGISEENTVFPAFPTPITTSAAGGDAAGAAGQPVARIAGTREIDLTPLQMEKLLTLARYVYGRDSGKHSITLGHTFSTHELEADGNISADGGFQLKSIRFRKHDGISDHTSQPYYSEFVMHQDFTVDPEVTRRNYYTGAAEIRPLRNEELKILMTEISIWLDEGGKWVKYPTQEDLRLKAIEKRAIELEKLYNRP